MTDLRGSQTPMDKDVILTPASADHTAIGNDKLKYQCAVGSLMYLMLGTCPDIAFAVSQVSRFSSNPTTEHWESCSTNLPLPKEVLELGIGLSKRRSPLVIRIQTGPVTAIENQLEAIFTRFGGAAISCSSKRQNTTALSSCEAEYMAASEAAKEALWMRRLLDHFDYKGPRQVIIHADSKSAIALAENPMHHGRTKHIEIRYHFIRETVTEGLIKLAFMPTKEEAADGMTKPLAGEAFVEFIKDLGLKQV